MDAATTGRLVILSGPSCVGKSPLKKALGKFYPHLSNRLTKLVLFNSRAPRPGELDGVDYHFSPVRNLKPRPLSSVAQRLARTIALQMQPIVAAVHAIGGTSC